MVYERVRGWTSGRSLPVQNFVKYPPVIKDPARPWGDQCQECTGVCSGHYMKPKDTVSIILNKGTAECNSVPPSTVLKDEFNRLKKYGIKITEEQVTHLAMKTLLTAEEVRMWIEHLILVQERRKT